MSDIISRVGKYVPPAIRSMPVVQAVVPHLRHAITSPKKTSYSQLGEDLLLDFLFMSFGDNRLPSYLDIGTNDPVLLSNTYFFYKKGAKGVCVEPNVALHKKIAAKRPRDLVLNVGCGPTPVPDAMFYVVDPSTMSTYSREYAKMNEQQHGFRILQEVNIPIVSINELLATHFPNGPDLLSIDIEGLDEQLVRAIDFQRHRPLAICVETLEFGSDIKKTGVINHLLDADYKIFADTFINTIFYDKHRSPFSSPAHPAASPSNTADAKTDLPK